jgi:formylglycine-generating enzyme required for sulfatase activity
VASDQGLTAKKNWAPPQKTMMRRATRHHVGRGLAVAATLLLLGLIGWVGYGRLEGRRLRDRVLDAKTTDVPGIVKEMASYRRWGNPLLQEAYAQAERDNDRPRQLHASLALLPADPGQVGYLYERLLKGEPHEVLVIRQALSSHGDELTDRLWEVLEDPKGDQGRRLRAACALAAFAPDDARWDRVNGDVAASLAAQNPFEIARWTEALKGVGGRLLPPLADFLVDEKRSVSDRGLIAVVYGSYASDTPDGYARLEKGLTETCKADATAAAKDALARKRASLGVALLVMGKAEKVWPLLKHGPDPTTWSYLIERLGPGVVDPGVLTARLAEEKDVSVRRAILLSLGDYGLDRMPPAERRNQLPQLLDLYRDNADPGIHGAAEWLVRQWGAANRLQGIDKALASGKVAGKRQWYVNRQGQTMVVVPKPGEFWMGEGFGRHKRRINRTFAISSKEVTVEQFLRFSKEPHLLIPRTPHFLRRMPQQAIAREPCELVPGGALLQLAESEGGIPKGEWCYEPNKEGKYAGGMEMAPNYLKRTGYRLPTEGEWEYACRAGADTGFSCGDSEDLLARYAWFTANSWDKSHPVGSLKPNDLGLFDMHGNVSEWCRDWSNSVGEGSGKVVEDREVMNDIEGRHARVLCGGSFAYPASAVRWAYSGSDRPKNQVYFYGFRLARTFSP